MSVKSHPWEDEEEDVRHASSGRKRTRTASDVSDVDAASDHPEAKNAAEMEKPSMKDSLLAAASRIELCTVRSPALKVLLEISFEEEFMMELVDSGVAVPGQKPAKFQRTHDVCSGSSLDVCLATSAESILDRFCAGLHGHVSGALAGCVPRSAAAA